MVRFSRQRVIDRISEEMSKITSASNVTPTTEAAAISKASEFIALGRLLALQGLSDELEVKAGIGLRIPVEQAAGEAETRVTVGTYTAARLIGREPGTLRRWSSESVKGEEVPLVPVGRIGRDLAWNVAELLRYKDAKERGAAFKPLKREKAAAA
jgi:hypothetical protein